MSSHLISIVVRDDADTSDAARGSVFCRRADTHLFNTGQAFTGDALCGRLRTATRELWDLPLVWLQSK